MIIQLRHFLRAAGRDEADHVRLHLAAGGINKNVYGNGIIKLQLGPFFDVGKITDPGTELGSHQWLFDTGAQARLRIFSSGLVFSYGKDLHTGNNAFYVTLIQ